MVKSGVKIPLSSCFPDGFVVQGSDVIRMWGLEQLKTAVSCEDTCFQGLGPVSVGASGFGIRVQFRVYFLAHAILAHDGPEPRESVAAKEEAEERMRVERQCAICFENDKNCMFNCGHRACMECAQKLDVCPVCREPVTSRTQVFD